MSTEPSTGGRCALVVDDNAQAAAISSTLLRANGWTVESARDGFEAIHLFRTRTYNAVVLDYCLPGMDGVEVLAWVRRNLSVAPDVVVVSGESTDFLRRRFEGLGVRAILSKPVAPGELIMALEAA